MPARIAIVVLAVLLLGSLGACARFSDQSSRRPVGRGLQSANLAHGKAVFAARCAICHGVAGSGGAIGAALRGERKRRTLTAVVTIVRDPLPPMPKLYPAIMNAQDVLDVSAYVDSL